MTSTALVFWLGNAPRQMIRYFVLASLMAGSASAQTSIAQYPFCIQGSDNPGWSGCSFNTLQACQAAAAGTDAECISNPWYQGGGNLAAPIPEGDQIGANSPLPVGPPPN